MKSLIFLFLLLCLSISISQSISAADSVGLVERVNRADLVCVGAFSNIIENEQWTEADLEVITLIKGDSLKQSVKVTWNNKGNKSFVSTALENGEVKIALLKKKVSGVYVIDKNSLVDVAHFNKIYKLTAKKKVK